MTYIVVPGSGSGTITPSDITPITDGTFPAVGQLFEIVYAENLVYSNTNVGVTGVWGYAHSITLDAGRWEIYGNAGLSEGSAVLTNAVAAAISDDPAGATILPMNVQEVSPFFNGTPQLLLTPILRVSITVNTTYYLNTRFFYSSGAPQHRGALWAKRYS